MSDHKAPSIDKARSQADAVENRPEHKYEKLQSYEPKAYFNKAYPEGYGSQLNKSVEKVEASNANLNLFNHRKAGFFSLSTDAVKEAKISDDRKQSLLRFAHSAWEIRAEADKDSGEVRNYFVLRDDVELGEKGK